MDAALPVPVPVAEGVDVCKVVSLALGVPLREVLGVTDGDAPLVREAVGEAERVELALRVKVCVGAGVPVAEGVLEAVAEGVTGGVALLDKDVLAELELLAPIVRPPVGEGETVELAERLLLEVTALVPVTLALGVEGGVALPESE